MEYANKDIHELLAKLADGLPTEGVLETVTSFSSPDVVFPKMGKLYYLSNIINLIPDSPLKNEVTALYDDLSGRPSSYFDGSGAVA